MKLSHRTTRLLKIGVFVAFVGATVHFAATWFIADDPFCWRGYIAYDGTCAWE